MNHERLLEEGWVFSGHIGVDSGQAMICDPCYIAPDDEHDGESWKPQFSYGQCCGWDKLALELDSKRAQVRQVPFSLGHEGAAVVCQSGYGDGYYPVYVKFEDKGPWGVRVVAMMVDFDTDDPSECEEKETDGIDV